MRIVFAIDDFLDKSNGTVMTSARFAEELRKRGHEVRIVSIGVEGEGMYSLKKRWIPIVSYMAAKQSTHFAKPDKKVIQKALEGADVVHFFMPFKLAKTTRKIAKKMGVTATAAFHTHPDNILYGAHVRWCKFLTPFIFGMWRRQYYKYFDVVHCPTKFAADEIANRGYKNKCHIISNGITSTFTPPAKKEERNDGFFNIICVGRLAPEKRQDLIIKAISLSKYKEKIKLNIWGKGPDFEKIKSLAGKLLVNQPEFSFVNLKRSYQPVELREELYKNDLYIHAADVEIEGITCIEAFASGTPCLISDAKMSATKQFAVDPLCIFKANDAEALAKRIDYFIENPKVLAKFREKYIEEAKYYKIDHSITKFEEMLKEAINDNKAKLQAAKTKSGKTMKRKIKRNLFSRLLSNIIYYGVAGPALFVFNKVAYNFKIKGKKTLKELRQKGVGAITISNHVHELDSAFVAMANFPKKTTVASKPENFDPLVTGTLIDVLGAVPTPKTKDEHLVFFYELAKKAAHGDMIHFHPEGELSKYNSKLRDFKRGAFSLSVVAKVPVVPMCITFKERKNSKKPPQITLHIGKAIYPNFKLLKKDAIEKLQEECTAEMQRLQAENVN